MKTTLLVVLALLGGGVAALALPSAAPADPLDDLRLEQERQMLSLELSTLRMQIKALRADVDEIRVDLDIPHVKATKSRLDAIEEDIEMLQNHARRR